MKVGFIGLGIMGKPMCANLLKEGSEVYISSSTPSTNEELKQLNANVVDNYNEVAGNSDVLILMLPNSQDVYDVVVGNNLYKEMKPGSVVLDMSSITPEMSRRVAEQLRRVDSDYIDAPVSGGEEKAIEGTLSIMAGGDAGSMEKVKPLLEIMGGSVTHVGEAGLGNATKLVNQVIVANNIIALSEGVAVAEALGLDLNTMYDAIKEGLAGSNVMDAKIGRMIDSEYEPGFKLDLHMKDLNNVFESLEGDDGKLPITSKTKEIMGELIDHGKGNNDHGALYEYYQSP
ncbi:NAD(P)-binding domain-containing protein [Salinicoccus sp. HZC-1]|uniref:NAD(P)-binding domain-containing protein n=1 Tax=Salinicoccus sp. HZC-1 TaxID=3385497 RepID=UPI00398BA0EE